MLAELQIARGVPQKPPGNLTDYFTKPVDGRHHQEVRPWYLHETTSQCLLPRTAALSTLRVRWCVGTLANDYIKPVHML